MKKRNKKVPLLERSVLGVYAIARLTGLNVQVVRQIIDGHLLRGYRLPGSGFRRVVMADFIAFCQKHDIPMG